MSLSPTSGRAHFFPFPRVYLALLQKMRTCFHCIIQRGCIASVLGDLVHNSLRLFQAIVRHHNGGKT